MAIQCTACDKVLRNPMVYGSHFASKHPDLPMTIPAPMESGPPGGTSPTPPIASKPAGQATGQAGQVVSYPVYRNPPQPEDAASKRDQFAAVAMNIGIKEPIARQIAWYLVENYDIDRPLRLAEGLNNKTELNPAQRRELWTTWTNRSNRNLSEDLKREVLSTLDPDAVPLTKGGHGSMEEQRFRLDGYLIVADDHGKLTWGQAKMIQQQLKEANQDSPKNGDNGNGGVMTELTRAALRDKPDQVLPTIAAMERWIRPPEDGGAVKAQTELMIQVMNAKAETTNTTIAAIQSQHKMELEMVREEQRRQAKELTDSLKEITAALRNKSNDSPWEGIDRLLPGASAMIMERFLNPRQNNDEAIRIDLGDEGGKMSIDTWERVESIKAKRANINWIRSMAPEFLDLGKAMVMALNDKKRESERALSEPESQLGPGEIMVPCVGCRSQLIMPEGTHLFSCNECGTKQDESGRVYQDAVKPTQAAPSDYETQEPEAPTQRLVASPSDDAELKPFPPPGSQESELAGVR